MLQKYLDDILKTARTGDATEPSYYPDLKNLLQNFLSGKGFDPSITIQAKRQIAGIPDFTVRKGRELIGYIEAKDPTHDNLENLPSRDTEQVRRYLEKLPNIIFTNFFDFWLYREGKLIKKVRIGFPRIITELKTTSPIQNEKQLIELLDLFFAYYIPEKKTPKALAEELAKRAQLLPQPIVEELTNKHETEIDRIYNAFKEYLMSDLTPESFADIYAQTLTYGLFTARLNYPKKDFDRKKAGNYIPKSVKILRDTFNLISGDAIPESLESYVDDIATILAHSDIEKIKEELKRKTGKSDPLIHFYETFLGAYDPAKRKSLGVYYTPLPVVSYITKSINQLLKDKFKIKDGLADEKVTLLDPASGTLTFPAEAINIAVEEQHKYSESVASLKNHFLNHFFAFEILMAPYIIGHLRMGLLFETLRIPLEEGERFPLYLTNSLDFSEVHHSSFPFIADLAEEAEEAKKVKEKDILVILGNPPYTSEKKEKGALPEWIKEKLQDYAKGLGVEKEKKKGVLQDDYVRFIRFAHWKIDHYGKGIVAFITNNSYLDGIIHRSMRKQLLDSFDEIYILNLHGNSRIHEKTPESGKDENVFDIQQGVAVSIFVKTGEKKPTRIFYKDLWGLREEKYEYLNKNIVSNKELKQIEPQANEFYFAQKDYALKSKWDSWLGLDEIFNKYVSGVESQKDNICIKWSAQEVDKVINTLTSNLPNEIIKSTYSIEDSRDWKLQEVRKYLEESRNDKSKIMQILYRPFDLRWTYFDNVFLAYPRKPLMDSLGGANKDNIALNSTRQLKGDHKFSHALVSDSPTDRILLSNTTSEASYVFPLNIVNKEGNQEILFERQISSSNFSGVFWKWFDENSLGSTVPPDDIFYYIYAVLYSNTYREKHFELLKSDFPHVPFTNNGEVFFKLSKLGNKLADLHLLKSDDLNLSSVKLYGEGDNNIEKREWKNDQVWINEKQYFAPVKEEIWKYYIGGYQVADKWLKDRQNRENPRLDREEIKTYSRMVFSILQTIEIQKEIDRLYPEIEKNLIS
ncbi:MAG: type ISP restriction/modification enzyme [bacterium]|nr:type ISP restriction/modification enzyme [bacterium]